MKKKAKGGKVRVREWVPADGPISSTTFTGIKPIIEGTMPSPQVVHRWPKEEPGLVNEVPALARTRARRGTDATPDPDDDAKVERLLFEVRAELDMAREQHGPMHSPHEGYAVIKEELDELWREVMGNRGAGPEGHREATQVAAMAVRYLLDLFP